MLVKIFFYLLTVKNAGFPLLLVDIYTLFKQNIFLEKI